MNDKPLFSFKHGDKAVKVKIVDCTLLVSNLPVFDMAAEENEVNLENILLVDKAFLTDEQQEQILEWAHTAIKAKAWDKWEQYYMEGGV